MTAGHAERITSRLEFETLISDLSSGLIAVPPDDVDREVEDAQRRVCEALGIDQSVLGQESPAIPRAFLATHIYMRGGRRPPGPMRQEQFPWVRQEILAGNTVRFTSADELPAEAAVDRENARLLGIKSSLTLPISVGGESTVACLAFNATRAERYWPDELVNRLQLVAQIFGNALVRERADHALRESQERLALAADSVGAALWSYEYDSGVFWVTDRARTLFGFTPDEVLTLESLEAVVHPDDWERVRSAIESAGRDSEPVDVEYRICQGDDTVRWISSRGDPSSCPPASRIV